MNLVDYTIEVTTEVVETLQSMRQISGNENGGILLGSEIGEQHYRINRVSEPCMLIDRSSKYGCIRDAGLWSDCILYAENRPASGTDCTGDGFGPHS